MRWWSALLKRKNNKRCFLINNVINILNQKMKLKKVFKINLFFMLFFIFLPFVFATKATTRLTTLKTNVEKNDATNIDVVIDASTNIRGGQFIVNLDNDYFEIVSVNGANDLLISSSKNFHLVYNLESDFSLPSGSAIATILIKPSAIANVGDQSILTVSTVGVTLQDAHDAISGGSESIILTVAESSSSTPEVVLSNNNFLKNLTSKFAEIEFDKDVLEYNVTVNKDVITLNLEAEVEDEKASYVINGDKDFATGENLIEIIVKAENNEIRTYMITVNVVDSDNLGASDLDLIIVILAISLSIIVIGQLYFIYTWKRNRN